MADSNGGAYDVKWRGDGKELYYQSLSGKVMAVAIQSSPHGIQADIPRELFATTLPPGTLHTFNVTGDGQRFLEFINADESGGANRLTIVSNWQAALKR